MANKDEFLMLKLLIIGDMGVGKSSLLMCYMGEDFCNNYISTIGVDLKTKTVMLDGTKAKVQIWDTAGQERFRTITSTYYRGAHGILIVYDVNDSTTFCNVEKWVNESKKYADADVPFILVGNKCEDEKTKIVLTQDASRLAAEHSCAFIETSAKMNLNVDQMFETIIRQAHEMRLRTVEKHRDAQPTIVKLQSIADTKNAKMKCCIN